MENIQVNVSEAIASFEAIKAKITEKGVKITDTTKARELAFKVNDVYEAGKQDEYNIIHDEIKPLEDCINGGAVDAKSWYDELWDGFQINGTRTIYYNAFAYGFSSSNFYPKYDINIAGDGGAVFYQIIGEPFSLSKRLDECGVKLDTSKAVNASRMFTYSTGITEIPVIDLTGITNRHLSTRITQMFRSCTNLVTIEKLIVEEDIIFDGCFMYDTALENIIIEGTIGQNGFDIHWSTKLSADSLKSIITALSTTTTGLTVTLPTTAQANYETVCGAGSWESLTASRSNWTIAYA